MAEHCLGNWKQSQDLISKLWSTRGVFWSILFLFLGIIQLFYSSSCSKRATACKHIQNTQICLLVASNTADKSVSSVRAANFSHAVDFLLLLGSLWQNMSVMIPPKSCGNWIVSQSLFFSRKCRPCGGSQKVLLLLQPKIRLWCHLMMQSTRS